MATGSNFTTRVPNFKTGGYLLVLNSKRVPVFEGSTRFVELFLLYITLKIAIFISTFGPKIIFSASNTDYEIFLSMFINARSIIFGMLEVFFVLQNPIKKTPRNGMRKICIMMKFYKNSLQNGYPGNSLLPGYPVSKWVPG